MKKYKVSICIPIYNAGKYLRDCLNSLVHQTLKDIEIVCVNDGSTDNSLNILNEYAKKYKNIQIINQENQGLGGARNTGIRNAHGEYIGFVDADDFVDFQMYEIMYNTAKINKADIVMCNLEFYPNDIKTQKNIWYKPYAGGVITGEFLSKNVQPWNKIVLRKLIEENHFEFYEKNGDGMFSLLMLYANKIVSVDQKLYKYRIGHDSMSTNYKLENFIISVNCAKELIKKVKLTKYKDSLQEFFEYNLIYSLIQVLTISALKNDKVHFNFYKKELKSINYLKNKYVKTLLKKQYSTLKYYGMLYILPVNFYLSRLLLKFVF